MAIKKLKLWSLILEESASNLEWPFLEEEIFEAVFHMDKEKHQV